MKKVSSVDETELFQKNEALAVDDDNSQLKTILLWTNYYHYGDYKYEFGELGRSTFIKAGCPENRCRTTNKRKMEEFAHVIVFHRW